MLERINGSHIPCIMLSFPSCGVRKREFMSSINHEPWSIFDKQHMCEVMRTRYIVLGCLKDTIVMLLMEGSCSTDHSQSGIL